MSLLCSKCDGMKLGFIEKCTLHILAGKSLLGRWMIMGFLHFAKQQNNLIKISWDNPYMVIIPSIWIPTMEKHRAMTNLFFTVIFSISFSRPLDENKSSAIRFYSFTRLTIVKTLWEKVTSRTCSSSNFTHIGLSTMDCWKLIFEHHISSMQCYFTLQLREIGK